MIPDSKTLPNAYDLYCLQPGATIMNSACFFKKIWQITENEKRPQMKPWKSQKID